jgi:CubicO group peptidase (beta-lactamase class C family)
LVRARLTAPVGSRFQCFNLNYLTLALIIKTVSGQPYSDYVQEHIFRPLGMEHSYGDHNKAVGVAQGHSAPCHAGCRPARDGLPFELRIVRPTN